MWCRERRSVVSPCKRRSFTRAFGNALRLLLRRARHGAPKKAPKKQGVGEKEKRLSKTRKTMKDNCCTLVPPHQLYRATHSCHLDRFLLPPPPQVLYHPCRKPPAAQRIWDHQGGVSRSQGPRSPFTGGARCTNVAAGDRVRLWSVLGCASAASPVSPHGCCTLRAGRPPLSEPRLLLLLPLDANAREGEGDKTHDPAPWTALKLK